MAQENIEVLRAGFEAVARGDLVAAQACFHPEAELRNATATLEGVTYRGANLVAEWAGAIREVWADYRLELEDITGDGDALVATIRNLGRAKGSGMPLDDRRCVAVTFKEGRIWRARTYGTREEALAAAGL